MLVAAYIIEITEQLTQLPSSISPTTSEQFVEFGNSLCPLEPFWTLPGYQLVILEGAAVNVLPATSMVLPPNSILVSTRTLLWIALWLMQLWHTLRLSLCLCCCWQAWGLGIWKYSQKHNEDWRDNRIFLCNQGIIVTSTLSSEIIITYNSIWCNLHHRTICTN